MGWSGFTTSHESLVAVEGSSQNVWLARRRALMDFRIFQCLMAMRLDWLVPREELRRGYEVMHSPATGGRFLLTGRYGRRQRVRTAYEVDENRV